MPVQTKRVKCPGCNAVLEVKNTKGEAEKIITCPGCKAQLRVHFPPIMDAVEVGAGHAPASGNTIIAGHGAAHHGDTELTKHQTAHCHPALLLNGQRFPLATGTNIVGRKAQSSTASVQLPTGDAYMSRQHIRITITPLPDGSVQAMLSNYKNMNPTSVNDQQLTNSDEIVLQSGYRIRMGATTVEYTE